MKRQNKSRNGFTLVELFISIAVILIIAGVFLGKASQVLGITKTIRVKAELGTIRDSIFLAESKTGKPLIQITNNSCPQCACYNSSNNEPQSILCVQGWLNTRATIVDTLGDGYTLPEKDPWGNPYQVEQNEGKFGPGGWGVGSCTDVPLDTLCDNNHDKRDDRDRDGIEEITMKDFCYPDLVISAGPDRRGETSDDIQVNIPFFSAICSDAL